ncbi:MAG: XrtY-associated glycosyltransferase XYAG1 [Flavisolibacter sp.]
MKIAHIVPSYKPAYTYGGTISSISKLCESLVSNGLDITVLTTTANGKEELNVEPGTKQIVDGVAVIYFKRITGDHTHLSPRLWTYLWKHANEFDIIHIHSWWNLLVMVSAMIARIKGIKLIISPRGMLSNYIRSARHSFIKTVLHALIGKRLLKGSLFHATSESEFRECRQIINGWNGFMLPNLLSLPKMELVKPANQKFTLIFLSRIDPKKGLELLFKAIAEFKLDLILRIAGSGNQKYIAELKHLAEELNMAECIQWLGWLGPIEKFKELMNADAMILPSHNENFANVVIESLYVGTPVIISEQVGLSSFVKQKNLGWVVNRNTVEIAQAIKNAITLSQQYPQDQKQPEKVQNEILKTFSEKLIIEKYIKNYSLIA